MLEPRCSLCHSTQLRKSHVKVWALPFTIVALPYRCEHCEIRQWHLEPVRTTVVICLELVVFFAWRG